MQEHQESRLTWNENVVGLFYGGVIWAGFFIACYLFADSFKAHIQLFLIIWCVIVAVATLNFTTRNKVQMWDVETAKLFYWVFMVLEVGISLCVLARYSRVEDFLDKHCGEASGILSYVCLVAPFAFPFITFKCLSTVLKEAAHREKKQVRLSPPGGFY
jgi:hypothetical protein